MSLNISEEMVQLVMRKTNTDHDKSLRALEKTYGSPKNAIRYLKKSLKGRATYSKLPSEKVPIRVTRKVWMKITSMCIDSEEYYKKQNEDYPNVTMNDVVSQAVDMLEADWKVKKIIAEDEFVTKEDRQIAEMKALGKSKP